MSNKSDEKINAKKSIHKKHFIKEKDDLMNSNLGNSNNQLMFVENNDKDISNIEFLNDRSDIMLNNEGKGPLISSKKISNLEFMRMKNLRQKDGYVTPQDIRNFRSNFNIVDITKEADKLKFEHEPDEKSVESDKSKTEEDLNNRVDKQNNSYSAKAKAKVRQEDLDLVKEKYRLLNSVQENNELKRVKLWSNIFDVIISIIVSVNAVIALYENYDFTTSRINPKMMPIKVTILPTT